LASRVAIVFFEIGVIDNGVVIKVEGVDKGDKGIGHKG
jgi:hypothetical protein